MTPTTTKPPDTTVETPQSRTRDLKERTEALLHEAAGLAASQGKPIKLRHAAFVFKDGQYRPLSSEHTTVEVATEEAARRWILALRCFIEAMTAGREEQVIEALRQLATEGGE